MPFFYMMLAFLLGTTHLVADKTSKKPYILTLATTWGSNSRDIAETSMRMARLAKAMSGGELIIRVDIADKHKAPLEVLEMVKTGKYDMGHSTAFFWFGKDVHLGFLSNRPFGMTAPEFTAWLYHDEGLKFLKQIYQKHNLVAFPGGNSGMQMGGWFKKEIKTLEDLKGLRMRIPGLAGKIMSKLGVAAANMSPGELYGALERGALDAVEWVSPSLDSKMGFHKIAKYYYTGWNEVGSEAVFIINDKVYAKLPDHLKQILIVAMRDAAYDNLIRHQALNTEAWQKMIKEHPDIKIRTFPTKIFNAMKLANDEMLAVFARDYPLVKKIIKSQDNYMKKVRAWTKISDFSYLKSESLDETDF